jgi:lysophospholipase L1-like esterase
MTKNKRNFIRFAMWIIKLFLELLIFVFVIFLYNCRTFGQSEPLPGKNYFDPNFQCEKGLVNKEKNLTYLKLREEVRKNFPPVEKNPFMVIAGESTMALFTPEIYQEYLSNYTIVNRAIGGETTLLLLTSLENDIIALKPDVILISIGGNDLLEGRCINNIINNVNLIFYNIRLKLPDTYIIFVSIPPVLSSKVNSVSPYLNQRIYNLLITYPKTIYFDLWEILAEEDKPLLQEKFYRKISDYPLAKYDLLHFNTKGYEEIAKRLKPILDKIYQEKNEMNKSIQQK